MLVLSCSAPSARAGLQQQYPQGAQDPAYTYLYDRRFSGGRSSYNAVFSQNSIRLTECLFYLVLNLYYSLNSAMFSWIINNSAMVAAYWNIGKLLFEVSGENERGAYGKILLGTISKQLTEGFGKGFTKANLRNMRQFFLTFPNCNALRSELNWTQYRMLMRIQNSKVRDFYPEVVLFLFYLISFYESSNYYAIFRGIALGSRNTRFILF